MATKLNAAGLLARAFIESRLTSVIIVASLALGIIALALTPREETPQIQVSGALISVPLLGASPDEVQNLIVTPLEGLLHGMLGVDYTKGKALANLGMVQVLFQCGESKADTLTRIYERVQAFSANLPEGAGQPIVKGLDTDSIPIFVATLASHQLAENELVILAERLAEKLSSVDGVSAVEIRGGQRRELRIDIDPVRLYAYAISCDQIASAVHLTNQSAFLEDTVEAGRILGMWVNGWLQTTDDVGRVVVGVYEGRPVFLRDVATISLGIPREERTRVSRLGFGRADERFAHYPGELPQVSVAVSKKKGADAVSVSADVQKRLSLMQKTMLPKDVLVVISRDDGAKADQAVNLLLSHLLIAIVSVGVVLVPLLGFRDACVVMATVPIIFSLTLGAGFFGGVSINRITLFALIIAMGLLVDAAIVVLENIHRHYTRPFSQDKSQVAISATNEIGNATNLATFAIMLVFASLFLVTGMPGDYFYPLAFNLPLCMIFSLLVAYIVVPWMARRTVPMARTVTSGPVRRSRLQSVYERILLFLFASSARQRTFGLGIVLLLALSLMMGAWQFVRPDGVGNALSPFGVAMGFLPKNNCNTFAMVLSMPEDTPIEQTDKCVREIGRVLAQNAYVTDYESWVGYTGVMDFSSMLQGTAMLEGSHVAEIRVNLINKSLRTPSSIDIVRELRPKVMTIVQHYPGARLRMVEDPPGPPMQATVSAELYGPDAAGLRELASKVEAAFKETYDMVDISTTEPVDVPECRLQTDKTMAALSGISEAAVVETLQWVYGGRLSGRLHRAGERESIPVRIAVPRSSEPNPVFLDRLTLRNSQGISIPLSSLVRVSVGTKERPKYSKNCELVSYIGGELSNSAQTYAVLDLNQRLQGLSTPDGRTLRTGNLTLLEQAPTTVDGYLLLWGGEMRLMLDIYRDLGIALGAALAVVFLLLVAYYHSYLVPVLAMTAVPLGLIGILPGHWLLGMDFSAASIIGIIALSGVCVRNSLLIIDFTREILSSGRPMRLAALEAGSIRLKPILLTTLAISLGSLIMVKDPVFGGLSISLIFGACSSTVFTIFVVPLLCVRFAKSIRGRS
ncbi:MAG: efflux RND transporter permease subunit [Desulfovibrionaceae bacterium]|nr:efflux RND transporter permease subunit [Desulfovibrionaceae bacterium]